MLVPIASQLGTEYWGGGANGLDDPKIAGHGTTAAHCQGAVGIGFDFCESSSLHDPLITTFIQTFESTKKIEELL